MRKRYLAPTIRYHEGVFYMITTNVSGKGNFLGTHNRSQRRMVGTRMAGNKEESTLLCISKTVNATW